MPGNPSQPRDSRGRFRRVGQGGSFFDRIDYLATQVGHGTIRLKVRVDQIYSHYIHEGVSRFTGAPLIMHEGGESHFLRNPLFEHNDKRMEAIALRTITADGSDLKGAFIDASEELSRDVYDRAPREFGDLRASGHPSVEDNGKPVYDRPPHVHRLSEQELRAKDHVRRLFRFERRRPR